MNETIEEGLSPEQFNIQFQSAYNDRGKKLRYYAKTFTNSTQDAEDIVATLFTDLWARGEAFNRDKLKWSYLQKAVHNASTPDAPPLPDLIEPRWVNNRRVQVLQALRVILLRWGTGIY